MKNLRFISIIAMVCFVLWGCEEFLERPSQNILTYEEVFSDYNLTRSVLADFYGRIDFPGGRVNDNQQFRFLNCEAGRSHEGPSNESNFADDFWRNYDYTLLRQVNEFLIGLSSEHANGQRASDVRQFRGEALFIRAWMYFNWARMMGGVPVVGDDIYLYIPGETDINTLRFPRQTEAGIYDYIISQLDYIINNELLLSTMGRGDRAINGGRATHWAALMLKARAAVYAGSLAKYTPKVPELYLPGGETGIPESRANGYYQIALEAAKYVIDNGPYTLYELNTHLGENFYEATTIKANNEEVIWTRDFQSPGQHHGFTNNNMITSEASEIDANIITPTLNLVEAFEWSNNTNPHVTDLRNGTLPVRTADGTDYVYYDNPEDLFAGKDPRLWGTVVFPGSTFRGSVIVYQAGQAHSRTQNDNGVWNYTLVTGQPDNSVRDGMLLTSVNGPDHSNAAFRNNTGFNFRKFMSYDRDHSTRGRGSDVWILRFRLAEAYMIAAEAAMELGDQQEATYYFNYIRRRADMPELSAITLDDIERERHVEFALEHHRWWDLKRWRRAHEVWNNDGGNFRATHWALFPYRINDTADPNHGKWIFERVRSGAVAQNPRNFRYQNYYNFIHNDWLANNPLVVRNPFQ